MSKNANVTSAHRLALLAGTSLREAERMLAGQQPLDLKGLAAKFGIPPGSVEGFVHDRKDVSWKPNPNQLTLKQLRQLPGVSAAGAQRALNGGPYFSLQEFAVASGAPPSIVTDLLAEPQYERVDKTNGAMSAFKPEPGHYVSELPPGFEDNEPDPRLAGFSILKSTAEGAQRFAIFAPSDFLAASGAADVLKQAVNRRLIPAVRDPQGLMRLFAPLRIDIWFKIGTPLERAASIIGTLGLVQRKVSPKLAAVGLYSCKLPEWPAGGDPFAAMFDIIRRAQEFEEVRFAEPDEIGIRDFPPDASGAPAGPSDFEAAGRFWNHEMCKVPEAHADEKGADSITIITIDSGVATGHPDLQGELRPDWQNLDLAFATEEPDEITTPESNVSHGTKVAGIAVGNGASADAVLGIAPGCRLLPVRISGDPTSMGYGMRAAAILHALSLVAPGQRAVMNISWGMAGEHTGMRTALEAALAAEVIVSMSAGNYLPGEMQAANQLHYPSSYCKQFRNIVSVAAVTVQKAKASYSFYGADTVTLCAPGGESGGSGASIYSAAPQMDRVYTYGTSFSVVHATGCAALMLSANSTLKAGQIVEMMRTSGQQLSPNEGRAAHMGPLLDIAAAVRRATGEPATPPVPPQPPAPRPEPVFPLNINTATGNQLGQVPSMSASRAQIIVADRLQNGAYASLWDLRRTGFFTAYIIEYWQQENLLTV